MNAFKGKITDIKDNKARVLCQTIDSTVSGWIRIPPTNAEIVNVDTNSSCSCIIKPSYSINDTVIILTFNNNLSDGIILCKEE